MPPFCRTWAAWYRLRKPSEALPLPMASGHHRYAQAACTARQKFSDKAGKPVLISGCQDGCISSMQYPGCS